MKDNWEEVTKDVYKAAKKTYKEYLEESHSSMASNIRGEVIFKSLYYNWKDEDRSLLRKVWSRGETTYYINSTI